MNAVKFRDIQTTRIVRSVIGAYFAYTNNSKSSYNQYPYRIRIILKDAREISMDLVYGNEESQQRDIQMLDGLDFS